MPTPYCPTCGYNLTALTQDVCPECGVGFSKLQLEEERFRAERFAVIAIFQVVLVPAAALALLPVFFFMGLIVVGDYPNDGFFLFATLADAGLIATHGFFLGRGYHRAKTTRFGSEQYNQAFKTALGYSLLFAFVEVGLATIYVVGGYALIS